jgi:hypothetical protein
MYSRDERLKKRVIKEGSKNPIGRPPSDPEERERIKK